MFNADIETGQLSNGARYAFANVTGARFISGLYGIHVGGQDETKHQAGTAHFLEHNVMMHGPVIEGEFFFPYFEKKKLKFNASTNVNETKYTFNGLNSTAMQYYDVMLNLVTPDRFNEQVTNKERTRILSEIDNAQLDINTQAFYHNYQSILPDQSASYPILGTKDIVKSLTPDEIWQFYADHYRADKAILAMSGDVDRDKVLNAFERTTNQYPQADYNKRGPIAPIDAYAIKPYNTDQVVVNVTFVESKPPIDKTLNSYFAYSAMYDHIFNEMITKGGDLYHIATSSRDIQNFKFRNFSFNTQPERVVELTEKFMDTVSGFSGSDISSYAGAIKGKYEHQDAEQQETYLWRTSDMYNDLSTYGRLVSREEERQYAMAITADSLLAANKILTDRTPSATFFGHVEKSNLPDNNKWLVDRLKR